MKLDGKISMAELRAFYPALAAVAEDGLRNPLDPDEAAWLDGPAFAKWLRRNGLKPQNRLGESVARSVRRWADGDAVSLGAADQVLTDLGLHINDIPARCWRNRPSTRKGRVFPLLVRDMALRDLDSGQSTREVADRYGISPKTLNTWTRERRRLAA